MNRRTMLEAFAVIVALVLIAALVKADVDARRDRDDAQHQSAIDEKAVTDSQEAIAHRDADAADLRKQLARQAAAVKTPQAAVKVIETHWIEPQGSIGAAGIPAIVQKADLPAATQAKLPDAPSYAILTDMQAEDVAKNELACDADRHDLAVCKADAVDLRKEISAKTDEAEVWEKAAKGGSRWQRLGRVIKFVACAGGGAAAGQVIDHTAQAAAIGGAAGVSACSLF